jgi:cyclophilin family peptidyl-prolyl cis-trans isomerase
VSAARYAAARAIEAPQIAAQHRCRRCGSHEQLARSRPRRPEAAQALRAMFRGGPAMRPDAQTSALALLSALALASLLTACGEEAPVAEPVRAEDLIAPGPHDSAVLEIRDMGSIRIELLRELAPQTVDNLIKLAEAGFYDGISFHRVVPGFVIQAGDPLSRNPDPRLVGGGDPGYTIPDEFSAYPHTRGVVSMGNKGRPNSGGSQFFIVLGDARALDGSYSVFGRVIEGMEVVDAITRVEVDTYGRYGPPERPHPVPVVIEAVRIERAADAIASGANDPRANVPARVDPPDARTRAVGAPQT